MFKDFRKKDYFEENYSPICAPHSASIAAMLGITPERLAALPKPIEPLEGSATYQALAKEPRSDDAKALVEALLTSITPKTGRKTVDMRAALGALIGDLLAIRAADPNGYGYRLMGSDVFRHQRIGRKPFRGIIQRLHHSGYVQVIVGTNAPPVPGCKGRATTVQPWPSLFDLAASHGITLNNTTEHFEAIFEPVALRATSERGWKKADGQWAYGKTRGIKLGVDYRHPTVFKSARMVIAINDALQEVDFGWPGSKLTGSPRLQRSFNKGMIGIRARLYAYDKGGRLYTRHGYQSLSKEDRALITINGEAVCEVDISGSYFTIAMARLGLPIDPTKDCYFVEGYPRIIVKSYINSSLGNGKPIYSWSDELVEEYAAPDEPNKPNRFRAELTTKKLRYTGDLRVDYPIADMKRDVLPCFPMLSMIEAAGIDWAPLSYEESCAVIASVHELCVERDVPCLPMHDAIICPRSQSAIVEEVLSRHFELQVGVKPKLSCS